MVDDEGEDGDGDEEELDPEGVVVAVVGGLELVEHEEKRSEGGAQEHHLPPTPAISKDPSACWGKRRRTFMQEL